MQLVPAGTTWLDVVTFAIAVSGLIVGAVGLILAVRRDRRESRAEVSIDAYVEEDDLVLSFTNTSHRPLAITRAGFNRMKSDGATMVPFTLWRGINARVSVAMIVSDPPLPSPALQPGDPTYTVRAPLHVVKGATYSAGVISAWCQDERGNIYDHGLSVKAKQAVLAVKRRVPGPDNDYGVPTEVEIDD